MCVCMFVVCRLFSFFGIALLAYYILLTFDEDVDRNELIGNPRVLQMIYMR